MARASTSINRSSAQRVACLLNQSLPAFDEGPHDIHLPEPGLIKVKGRTITVLDCQKLRAFNP